MAIPLQKKAKSRDYAALLFRRISKVLYIIVHSTIGSTIHSIPSNSMEHCHIETDDLGQSDGVFLLEYGDRPCGPIKRHFLLSYNDRRFGPIRRCLSIVIIMETGAVCQLDGVFSLSFGDRRCGPIRRRLSISIWRQTLWANHTAASYYHLETDAFKSTITPTETCS